MDGTLILLLLGIVTAGVLLVGQGGVSEFWFNEQTATPARLSDVKTRECTAVNNKRRHVILDKPDGDQACELLGEIEARICRLTTSLVRSEPNVEQYSRLASRMKYTQFNEASSSLRFQTNTRDKGARMEFCLRDSNDKLYDINLMMFVAIHELAHVMSVSFDHTSEFDTNFKTLLERAVKLGIYSRIDFSPSKPQPYCNTVITHHP
jgi:hypothetical protein